MRSRDMSAEEIVQRGLEIYNTQLKPVLEPRENDRYVVLSVENGDYVLADTLHEAAVIMRERYPDQVFMELAVGRLVIDYWLTPSERYALRQA